MAQVIYAKYNKLRRKEFRVRTCIYEEDGLRWVEKCAVCPEAEPHVRAMPERKDELEKAYPGLRFAKAQPTDEGVRFDYLTGETLDSLLARKTDTAEELIRAFEKVFQRILPDESTWVPFSGDYEEFCKLFGPAKELGGKAAPCANLDCILENIIVDGGDLICLDYEWVFDFPVPIDFMRYRVVHYFYQAHPEMVRLISGSQLLAGFGLTPLDCAAYAAMELEFQRYVFGGEADCRYTENYRQPVTDYAQMTAEKEQDRREIDELKKVVGHYGQVEGKLRKIGLWQAMQAAQKLGRKVKSIVRRS